MGITSTLYFGYTEKEVETKEIVTPFGQVSVYLHNQKIKFHYTTKSIFSKMVYLQISIELRLTPCNINCMMNLMFVLEMSIVLNIMILMSTQ